MPRRYVIRLQDMQRRRRDSWAYHYESREIVRQLSPSLDVARVLSVLRSYIPVPELDLDGSLFESRAVCRGMMDALDSLRWSTFQRRLMCVWYWSQEEWLEFVRQYQALPDIYEDHYLVYDKEADAGRLVPMSSKPKQGSVDNLPLKGTSIKIPRNAVR